eukprot:2808812-Pyramimonas_sp.AAC.1
MRIATPCKRLSLPDPPKVCPSAVIHNSCFVVPQVSSIRTASQCEPRNSYNNSSIRLIARCFANFRGQAAGPSARAGADQRERLGE